MARQTHYSKGYLSKIETGAKRATVDVARRCDQILRAEGGLLRLLTKSPENAEEADNAAKSGRSANPVNPAAPATPGNARNAVDAQAGQGDGVVPGRTDSDAVRPYRGLSAFTAQDAGWFFGRERATAALVERIFERIGSGPLMVVAPSGAGKSSLFHAGLVPAFRNPGGFPMPGAERWPVVAFTPTAHPLEELLTGFAKALDGDLGVTVRQLRDRPEILLEAVRRTVDDSACDDGGRRPPPVRPVLLVDQFEELFTLCSDEDERRAFVRVLCAVSTSRGPSDAADVSGRDPAVVVLGVRADLSGRCVELPELATVFTDGLFVLPPMSVTGLRDAITRPAELAGLALEPGLVPLLLRDAGLRDEPAALPGSERGALPGDGSGGSRGDGSDVGRALPDVTPSGALPLISHALLTTWQRREDATLTVAGYERTGGIRGAVARTAEDVFAGLYPAEQQTIRRILVRLVHVADGTGPARCRMSRAALMERLADTDGATAALDAFVRARLITADRDTVEIAHEALLHAWPRLRGWIDADRHGLLIHQQLAHAAEEWEREGGDPSTLYRGTRLDTVRTWAEELDGRSRLSAQEEAFLRASRAEEADRQRQARRQIRRRQGTLATLVVLLALAVVAGALAYRQRSDALQQERVARSRALAAQSVSLAAGQPEASMRLAGEAYRSQETPEARGALLSTQAQPFSARLGGHRGPVNSVAFAPDGRTLATASSDGTVTLRRLADRRTTATFTMSGRVRSVAFSPDGRTLAAGATDAPVQLWGAADHRTKLVLPAGTVGARAVAFDPRGRTLAVAARDGTVQVWDTDRGRRVASFTGHAGQVDALAYAPDGRTLASAGADRSVRLWDTVRDRPSGVLEGHSDEVYGVAFAPDGRSLASGGADRTVRLWDLARHRTTSVLSGHSDDVNAVAYTPDGATVVSAGGDGTTRLWDVHSGTQTLTLTGHTDYTMGVAVNADGTRLATAGFDQSVVLWHLGGPVLTARPYTEIWQSAYSPDGRLLATADTDHTVRLWDVARHRPVTTLRGHRSAVFSVAFAPDGRTLASGGSDGTVRLWDVVTHRLLGTLTGHHGDVFSVAFGPDGALLASAGADRTVRLWDVVTRRPLATLTGHTDFVNDVTFSPDGRTLASAGDDLTVRLWDVAGRRPRATLTGHTGAVRGVAFGPDGRALASSGNDGTVRLWDVRRHRPTAVLRGHTGSVRGIAFSPDGRLLASSGSDRTVRLWDVAARRPWAALTGHTNAVWGTVFSPDGRTVASSSNDGTVRLWNLDVSARFAAICRLRLSGAGASACSHR